MTLGTRNTGALRRRRARTRYRLPCACSRRCEIDVRLTRERYGQSRHGSFCRLRHTGSQNNIRARHLPRARRTGPILHATDSILVNNPESNMNNGLGVSPILDMLKHGVTVGVGTDGISSHLISQARAMYLHQRAEHRDPTLRFCRSLRNSAEEQQPYCNRLFAEARGALAPGQLADVVIRDYVPFTPLNADTLYGHLNVRHWVQPG